MEVEFGHWIDEVDRQVQAKHLLKHDFYQAWSRGELSMECLREYAKEYYQHVKAFATYLTALHSRMKDMKARRILVQNIAEEELGKPNHPELWKNFALALGVCENELNNYLPSHKMEALMTTFREICGQESIAEGITALYAYESQIPEICESKIAGLVQNYGMKNPQDWEYFHVHVQADKEHAAQERSLLKEYISKDNWVKIQHSLNKTLDALWDFLSDLCQKHNIICHLP